MPGKNVCSRIADPAARRRCENYQGEFAQAGPAAGPTAAPAGPPSRSMGRAAPGGNFGAGRWGGNKGRRRRPGPGDRRY